MALQNPINNIQLFNGKGEVSLTNYKFVSANSFNMINGNTDVYTCPAGKRAAVYKQSLMNNNAGTITGQIKIKVSGTYYPISSVFTMTTGTNNSNLVYPIILEAAESLSCTTNGTGVNFNSIVLEYDNTVPMFTKKILSMASGNNTLYTCPASKTACILDNKLSTYGFTVSPGNNLNFYNGTAVGLSLNIYLVNSGQAIGTSYLFSTGGPAASTVGSAALCGGLTTGDFIAVNTASATAGQMAWVNIMETA